MKSQRSFIAEVKNTLQHIADGADGVYELDDCFSVSFEDPKLESIRQHLWRLPDEFPPEAKGQFCGHAGMDVIRGWIQELSHDDVA
jgi:hypothetical protein